MKARKKHEIKKRFAFEAPMLSAAFPAGLSPKSADQTLDLNHYLAPRPQSIFMVRVNGESMVDENIQDGDILIVDRNARPEDGLVVIAALNGEMAVKTFRVIDGKAYLFSANKKFLPIEIGSLMQFEIQGVVKHVIRNLE